MARKGFEEGLKRLSGKYKWWYGFTADGDEPATDFPTDKARTWKGASVVLAEPEKKGVRPHVRLVDSKGGLILDVGAKKGCYSDMLPLVGTRLDSLRAKAFQGDCLSVDFSATVRYAPEVAPDIEMVVLDTETTGIDPTDNELLQVSLIDQDGETLWNRLYRPERVKAWPEAAAINGITPEKVAGRPPFREEAAEFQQLLDRARCLVIYNSEFDLAYMGMAGIRYDTARVRDAMTEYGLRYHGNRFYKLTKAAEEIGFSYDAHDALEDVRATLAVIETLDGKRPAPGIAEPPRRASTASRQRYCTECGQPLGSGFQVVDGREVCAGCKAKMEPADESSVGFRVGKFLGGLLGRRK